MTSAMAFVSIRFSVWLLVLTSVFALVKSEGQHSVNPQLADRSEAIPFPDFYNPYEGSPFRGYTYHLPVIAQDLSYFATEMPICQDRLIYDASQHPAVVPYLQYNFKFVWTYLIVGWVYLTDFEKHLHITCNFAPHSPVPFHMNSRGYGAEFWIQIDFGSHIMRVTGFQPDSGTGPDRAFMVRETITHFKLLYTLDRIGTVDGSLEVRHWMWSLNSDGLPMVYEIPKAESMVNPQGYGFLRFPKPITARSIRFYAAIWITCLFKLKLFGIMSDKANEDLQMSVMRSPQDLDQKQDLSILGGSIGDGCVLFDFEDGKLTNWTTTGNAFDNQPTFSDAYYLRTRKSGVFVRGRYYVSSLENHPSPESMLLMTTEKRRGTLTSPSFLVRSASIRFQMGGGGGPVPGACRVELLLNGRVFSRVDAAVFSEVMRPYVFNVTSAFGRMAQIRIVDDGMNCSIMVDDFRHFVDCSGPEDGSYRQWHRKCNRALGMAQGYIADSQIFANNTVDGFEAKNARIRSYDPSETPWKGNYMKSSRDTWLEITLGGLHLLDRFEIMNYVSQDGKDICTVHFLRIMYADQTKEWMYVNEGIKSQIYPMEYPVKNQKMPASFWFNPKIAAVFLRFLPRLVDSQNADVDGTVCLKLELYGCRKGETLLDKARKANEGYQLSLVTVTEYDRITIKEIALTCSYVYENFQAEPVSNELGSQFEWYEIVLHSRLRLPHNTRSIIYKYDVTLMKRTVQCLAYVEGVVLLTKDFIVYRDDDPDVTFMFVTEEPRWDFRGGRLITTSPAVLYQDSFNIRFFTVNVIGLLYTAYDNYRLIYCDPQPAQIPNSDIISFEMPKVLTNASLCARLVLESGYIHFYYNQLKRLCLTGPGIAYRLGVVREHARFMQECDADGYGRLLEFYTQTKDKYKEVVLTIQDQSNKVLYESKLKLELGIQKRQLEHGMDYFKCAYTSPEAMSLCGMSIKQSYGNSRFIPVLSLTFMWRYSPAFLNPQFSLTLHSQTTRMSQSQYIHIRHVGEPKIDLQPSYGMCYGEYAEIVPRISEYPLEYNAFFQDNITWYRVEPATFATPELLQQVPTNVRGDEFTYYQSREKLIFYIPTWHTGFYELRVGTVFGFAKKRTRVVVQQDFPKIIGGTPSPFIAVEGDEDILEIQTNRDDGITQIDWYKDNERIFPSEQFSFPDASNSQAGRKRLLLKNFDAYTRLIGRYRVFMNGTYCSSERTFDVDVHVKPKLLLAPPVGTKDYMFAREGTTLVLSVSVKKNYPAITEQSFHWAKGGNRIFPIKGDLLQIASTKHSNGDWVSVLTIQKMTKSDEGTYSFIAIAGQARSSVARIVYILPGSSSDEDLVSATRAPARQPPVKLGSSRVNDARSISSLPQLEALFIKLVLYTWSAFLSICLLAF